MRLSKLFHESALYFAGNIIRRVIGFVMIPLYTRYLTPSDYGIIELVELFIAISTITFGILAASDAMVRIYHDQKDEANRRQVIFTAIAIVAGASIVLAAVAAFAAPWLSTLVFGDASQANLIRAAFAAMLFSNVVEIGLVYQRLLHRAVFFVVFSSVQTVFSLALNIYFIAFAGLGVNAFVAGKLISSVVACCILMPIIIGRGPVSLSAQAAKQLTAFGGPLILTSASFFVIHFADRFFLQASAGLHDVGIYALAYRFAFLITFLVGEPFGSVWNVSLYARTAVSGWKEEFSRVARYLLLGLFVACIGLTLYIDEVLALVAEPAYASAALVVPALALAYVFREIGDFFRGVMFINKRVAQFSRITVGCAVLNLILNTVLISRYQTQGAAWATLLTWLFYMGACWYMGQREHSIPGLLRPLVSLCISVFVVWGATQMKGTMPLAWGALVDTALLVLVFVSLWLTGYISPKETASLRTYLIDRKDQFFTRAQRLRWS
jgi:O-antigen/teichoic acid export membrane protein